MCQMKMLHEYLLAGIGVIFAAVMVVVHPAPHNVNGKIAFVHREKDIQQIYLMDSDGTHRTKLSDEYWDSWPVWSPDGTKIAFKRKPTKDSATDLYVMNADGHDAKLLAHDVEFQDPPAWSPDGSKLAFASWHERDHSCTSCWSSIHVVNVDGTHEVQLTGVQFFRNPTWSPDGKKIAFVNNGALLVMNADGSDQVELRKPNSALSASWSPDGHEIMTWDYESFNDDSGAEKMRPTIRAVSALAVNSDGRLISYGDDPAWSPDGAKVVFCRGTQIFVIDASGAHATPLGDSFGADYQPAWGTAAQAAKN